MEHVDKIVNFDVDKCSIEETHELLVYYQKTLRLLCLAYDGCFDRLLDFLSATEYSDVLTVIHFLNRLELTKKS